MSFSRMVSGRLSSYVMRQTAKTHFQPRLFCQGFQTASSSFSKKTFSITYELADGTQNTVPAKDGDNLLDVAVKNGVEIDGFGVVRGH